MKLTQFEDLTIGQIKELFEEWKLQNPEVQTAEELLEELNKEKGK